VLLALAAGVVALTLAACGGSDTDEVAAPAESSEAAEPAESAPSDFEAAMLAASDRVEQAFEDVLPASDEGIRPGVFGEDAPAVSAALTAYAVELEGLEPPEEFREELARLVIRKSSTRSCASSKRWTVTCVLACRRCSQRSRISRTPPAWSVRRPEPGGQ